MLSASEYMASLLPRSVYRPDYMASFEWPFIVSLSNYCTLQLHNIANIP